MENVKVTVILSTFNQAPYIAQAIDSVLMQKTNFAFEILVADDCSTDGTQDIILEYQKRYPNLIRTYFTPQNVGGCRKFIDCLEQGLLLGDYLAFLEGDDYWLRKDRLQLLADFLDAHPEYVRVSHRTMIVDENGNQKAFDLPLKECGRAFSIEDFLAGKQYSFVDSMYRNYYRDAGGRYYELILASRYMSDFQEMFITEDFGKVYILPDCLSAYRSRSKASESNYNSIMSEELRSVDFIQVARAVEAFYQGRYDLSPTIRNRQKRLVFGAVELRDKEMFGRSRAFISEKEMRAIAPEVLFRLLRRKDLAGAAFLKQCLTRQEKFGLFWRLISYAIHCRTHNAADEEKLRGYLLQP